MSHERRRTRTQETPHQEVNQADAEKEVKRLAVLSFVVMATHYGYFLFEDQASWFYVLRGIEGTVLFVMLACIYHRVEAVQFVCIYGAAEEIQTALCGFADVVPGYGMCLSKFGPIPYAALAATGLVYLARKAWPPSPKP